MICGSEVESTWKREGFFEWIIEVGGEPMVDDVDRLWSFMDSTFSNDELSIKKVKYFYRRSSEQKRMNT